MEKLNDVICSTVYNFMIEHIDEVKPFSIFTVDKKDMWKDYGYPDETTFLNSVKNNIKDAIWCLTELMTWGMKRRDYTSNFIVKEGDENSWDVYKMSDRYFTFKDNSLTPIEVKPTKKIIEIEVFEEI